jgi:hypothetical protein
MAKWISFLLTSTMALAQVQPDTKLRANRDTYSSVRTFCGVARVCHG